MFSARSSTANWTPVMNDMQPDLQSLKRARQTTGLIAKSQGESLWFENGLFPVNVSGTSLDGTIV